MKIQTKYHSFSESPSIIAAILHGSQEVILE